MFRTGETAYAVSGNASSCTTASCNLYETSGENVSVPLLPNTAKSANNTATCDPSYFMADGRVKPYHMIARYKDIGTTLPDIMLVYCGINTEVCEDINIRNSIRNVGDTPVNASFGGLDYTLFVSTATNPLPTPSTNVFGDLDSRVAGKTTFCWERERLDGGPNWLVHIILER